MAVAISPPKAFRGLNVEAVERSRDLVNWLPLQTNSLGSGLFYFGDPGARGRPQQFYRARLLR